MFPHRFAKAKVSIKQETSYVVKACSEAGFKDWLRILTTMAGFSTTQYGK